MNKVVLVGRLTRDPELRYTSSAEPLAVASYTVAVNRRGKSEGQPDADFILCKVFGKQADFAAKYFKKGMQVAVSGRIQVSSWDDQHGQKRWSTEVILDDQEFAESKASFESRENRSGYDHHAQPQPPSQYGQPQHQPPSTGFAPIEESIDEEDLPF